MRPWVMASRPRTLSAAVVPVVVGTALAARAGAFDALLALAALAAAVLIQIGANLANDVHDFKRGADTPDRIGPTRVTSSGLLSPDSVLRGTWVVFGLTACFGLFLVYRGGWPILAIGVASIVAAVAYTAGPFPLGYNGLGDLAVFVFFGLAGVVGSYFVQTGEFTWSAVLAAAPVGAITTTILIVNNVRDVDTDRAAGKRTLAVLLGRNAARLEYGLLMLASYAVPLVWWLSVDGTAWVLLPLLSLPLAIRLTHTLVTRVDGPTLNRALAGTAQLLAVFGLLFALGLLL